MTNEHTPLPWRIVADGIFADSDSHSRVATIFQQTKIDPLDPQVKDIDREALANAALIVRAVNTIDEVRAQRDRLLEELKRSRNAIIDSELKMIHARNSVDADNRLLGALTDARQAAQAAIAECEGAK